MAALPKTQIIKNVAPVAAKSANGAVLGEVLVRFKAGTTELARVQAVKAALATPVNVTTLQNVKKRVGLRTVTQTVETVTKKVVAYKSLTPVLDSKITLTSLGYDQRLNRGTAVDVQSTAKVLGQWYLLRVDPPTANLSQVIALLSKQASIEKAESNVYVQAAAAGVASGTAGNAIKLSDAQNAAYVAPGDCNVDKVVDGKDLRILVNYMFNKGPQPKSLTAADVNRDGAIDIADLTALVQSLYSSTTAGYADLTSDGQYTSDDVNYLAAYLYSSGPAPSPLSAADYNKDGSVDIADLTMGVHVVYNSAASTLSYGRGDANADGKVDVRDVEHLVAYLFNGGPAPSPLGLADMDLDSSVDIVDLTILVSALYNDAGGVQAAAIAPSVSSNISAVESTTQPATPPAFLLADSNADGRVNAADLNHLVAYLFTNGPAPSPLGRADLDADSSVDIADLTAMVEMLFTQFRTRVQAADLNADGAVNTLDVTYLVNYLFKQGPAPDLTKADIDADGSVDIADLTVLVEFAYQTQPAPVCADVRTVNTTTFLNGDLDANGSVTDADLSVLAKIVYAKAAQVTPVERGDINCDTVVNPMDLMVLNAKLKRATIPDMLQGDANADGIVDPKDIAASTTTPTDVNGDGAANIRDTFDLIRLLKLNKATKTLPDMNADEKVDWKDADVMVQGAWKTNGLTLAADVNGDGTADAADAYAFVSALQSQQTVTSILAGDANADRVVDCRDVRYLHAAFFTKGPLPSPAARGDVNGDGTANVADALLLAKRACPALGEGTIASDVKIALLDSGVSATQATLAPSKEHALNKKDDDGNGYIDDLVGLNAINSGSVTTDCNGHGTALARMLASKTGVASRSQIIPVKVLDCKGRGYIRGVVHGLVYATVRGADIAELPFSGFGTSTLLADAVKYARASGMLVVAAAGNDGTSMTRVVPANVSGVLSVSSTTSTGSSLTSYSNTGASLAAPGNATGVIIQGTSVSATYVTGTAALALAKNPKLTLNELTVRLLPKTASINSKTPKVLDALSATTQ